MAISRPRANRSDFADGEVAHDEPAPDASLIYSYLAIMFVDDTPPWKLLFIREDFARLSRADAKHLRMLVREVLEDVVDSLPRARRERRARIDVMLDSIAVATDLRLRKNGHVEHLHRYAPKDQEGAIALLWAFLLDPDRPFGKALRVCALTSCGKYFLAEKNPAGGRRPKYCSPEHGKIADAQRAPDRVRASRARKRKKP